MFNLPSYDEIRSCSKVIVLTKEPLQRIELQGKPLKVETNTATKEINITTEQGFYSFWLDDLLSVQFLK